MATVDDALAPPGSTDAVRDADRLLLWAAAFFTVAVLFHNFDHVRRGADTLSGDVFAVGTAAIFLEVAVVVLVCQRHRLAPLAAVSAGFALAAGYVVVHFLPARSWLSDSFTSAAEVSPLSWAAASIEVVAALALGVAGLVALRSRGGLASAARAYAGEASLAPGVVHPVALTMAIGNAVILAVSIAQAA
ncbi:MAG TPA: hypothetical protein VM618_11500 [Acidimicrobiia bacterium]|nr:hypothetical protein [Acidimicrobiia bacterium]